MKHIKVFEKFGEIDELFLGVKINKGELENGIYDSLIELSDEGFNIEVYFDNKLGINVEINKKNHKWFSVSDLKEYIYFLEDYIRVFFGDIKVEYVINNNKYYNIEKYSSFRVRLFSVRFKK